MIAWMDHTYSTGYRISRVHEFPFRRRVNVPDSLIDRAEWIDKERSEIQEELKEAWASGEFINGEIFE